MILAFSNYQPIATFYFNNYAFFIVQTLILVLVLQCNFGKNDLIGKFARIGNVAKITRYTLHCTALHCTALHCTALHCTALHCTALHCTALHCTALHCTALHCTALHCTALHCTALHCTALHCTTLHYTATLVLHMYLRLVDCFWLLSEWCALCRATVQIDWALLLSSVADVADADILDNTTVAIDSLAYLSRLSELISTTPNEYVIRDGMFSSSSHTTSTRVSVLWCDAGSASCCNGRFDIKPLCVLSFMTRLLLLWPRRNPIIILVHAVKRKSREVGGGGGGLPFYSPALSRNFSTLVTSHTSGLCVFAVHEYGLRGSHTYFKLYAYSSVLDLSPLYWFCTLPIFLQGSEQLYHLASCQIPSTSFPRPVTHCLYSI